MRIFTGIAASPGIAVGRLKVVDRQRLAVSEYPVSADGIAGEISRLKAAIAATRYTGFVAHEHRPTAGRDPVKSLEQCFQILDV